MSWMLGLDWCDSAVLSGRPNGWSRCQRYSAGPEAGLRLAIDGAKCCYTRFPAAPKVPEWLSSGSTEYLPPVVKFLRPQRPRAGRHLLPALLIGSRGRPRSTTASKGGGGAGNLVPSLWLALSQHADMPIGARPSGPDFRVPV